MVMTEQGPEGRVSHRRERRSWMSAVPLLVIPLLAYLGFAGAGADFAASRFPITLPSAGVWQLTLGDILLVAGLFLLFFEILKATRSGGNSVVDHALSMIVFVVCLILFLIWDRAATSTFFLLMLMAMIDVIAGFSVTINAARRDYSAGGGA
jgi:asparagine N-glycosylation enzyme membrane subunit Stt3